MSCMGNIGHSYGYVDALNSRAALLCFNAEQEFGSKAGGWPNFQFGGYAAGIDAH
jgi:hypothetical protein